MHIHYKCFKMEIYGCHGNNITLATMHMFQKSWNLVNFIGIPNRYFSLICLICLQNNGHIVWYWCKSKYFIVVLYFYIDQNIFMCVICVIWTKLCDSVIVSPQIILCGLNHENVTLRNKATLLQWYANSDIMLCHTGMSYATPTTHKIMMLQKQ